MFFTELKRLIYILGNSSSEPQSILFINDQIIVTTDEIFIIIDHYKITKFNNHFSETISGFNIYSTKFDQHKTKSTPRILAAIIR
jgi:hypothetical protein